VVDTILKHSKDPHAKFLALQILDEAINTRWKILPEEQKQGIKGVIIHLVNQMVEDEASSSSQQNVITKLNSTLVSIVKQEWTVTWNSFISEMCNSATESQNKCENTLNILKLLSEEVFDFSKSTLIRNQAQELKQAMTTEFGAIFELCNFVITNAIQAPETIKQSLIR